MRVHIVLLNGEPHCAYSEEALADQHVDMATAANERFEMEDGSHPRKVWEKRTMTVKEELPAYFRSPAFNAA